MKKISFILCLLLVVVSLVACSDNDDDSQGGNENVYRPNFVDLGLPSGLLWADCNIGAKSPYEAGNYYAWGETNVKKDYSLRTYKWWQNDKMTKYTSEDGRKILEGDDDAAIKYLGSFCRMPTVKDFKELKKECTWSWVSVNGMGGFIIKGHNGNTIFLIAAGYHYDKELHGCGEYSFYWMSDVSTMDYNMARAFIYGKSFTDIGSMYNRFTGMTIRPVADK